MFNVIILKSLKLLLALDKLTGPKRLVSLCVTGHAQTPNYNKFLRLFTCRQMFSFLAHLQNKNPESVCEWPGTIKTAYISGTADGGWAQAADPAVTAQAAARSDRCSQ